MPRRSSCQRRTFMASYDFCVRVRDESRVFICLPRGWTTANTRAVNTGTLGRGYSPFLARGGERHNHRHFLGDEHDV